MSSSINRMDEKTALLGDVATVNTGEENPYTGTVRGLTIVTCAMFIFAEMAGSGVLALPKAIVDAGWTGFGLLMTCCIFSLYCGIILGKCWILVRERHPAYHKDATRDPYPLIGKAAAGKVGKTVVEVCVLVTLFGVCVVFLLLASRLISQLLDVEIGSFSVQSEFRLWILICGAILLPFTWLATPKDLWPFAVGAALCTTISCILMVARSGMKLHSDGIATNRGHVTAKSFFNAFGTIAFSFGGATLFPTFQTDMKEPRKFPYAAVLGFGFVLLLYIPMTLVPYLAFGDNIDPNLLVTLNNAEGNGHALVDAAEALIAFHLLFAFVITLNPISQQVEEYLNMSHKFGWRRVVIRTILLLAVLGVAELIPHFESILGIIGGTTVTMMAFILPSLFYLLLESCAFWVKVLHVEIILVAVVMGCASTYSAISGFKNPF